MYSILKAYIVNQKSYCYIYNPFIQFEPWIWPTTLLRFWYGFGTNLVLLNLVRFWYGFGINAHTWWYENGINRLLSISTKQVRNWYETGTKIRYEILVFVTVINHIYIYLVLFWYCFGTVLVRFWYGFGTGLVQSWC